MVAFLSTSKMQTEDCGFWDLSFYPLCPRRAYKKGHTYLAMIARVLQDSPDKMLPFSQLIDKLEPFVTGDKRRFENNIRVCLSSSKCFVKIPMKQVNRNCKINHWKFDQNQISSKMVRRHFKGMLVKFPELASKLRRDTMALFSEPTTTTNSPEAAPCSTVMNPPVSKFSSPFSIESLLKRDCPSEIDTKHSPISEPIQGKQQHTPWFTDGGVGTSRRVSLDSPHVEPCLQGSGGRFPSHTTWDNTGHGSFNDARLMTMMPMFTEAPFLIHPRPSIAPYFPCQQSCYTSYPIHTFNRDVQQFL